MVSSLFSPPRACSINRDRDYIIIKQQLIINTRVYIHISTVIISSLSFVTTYVAIISYASVFD